MDSVKGTGGEALYNEANTGLKMNHLWFDGRIVPLDEVCHTIIIRNYDKWIQAKADPKLIGWFVGRIMTETHGTADPYAVETYLKVMIETPEPMQATND